ncbi:hypothetical protein [Noviherbaspirillum autotrophicum]|uniref:Porin n=1 Tax=Noviherbaspirillum autotrophicum TaxID=709839 RepID=A0A0C2BUR3_9BURK|nr:hypothetical protein [Noviherbaspirillum autotrophicum]KIF83769.1 hypothetical protein TSA66_15275 [Noviherbaspirillum autotrophicum]
MLKHTVLAAALAAAFGAPFSARAAGDKELAQLREEIRQMKQDYEARIQALENRLQAAEAQAVPTPAGQPPAPAAGATANANAFNPEMSLILGGTYANLQQDPRQFRIQGFVPGGEDIGPGARSFNLGESELTLRANIDPQFAGQMTFALAADNSVGVEEAFFRTRGLSNGLNLKGGRFLSAIGYLNSQHAHAWDFVDAPLAYQAFFGGQFRPDGVQLTWLAPAERFVELGVEAGNGAAFPGSDRNKNGIGSSALFAHVGDDIGDSASWRLGASLLHTSAAQRSFDDGGVTSAFSGRSNTWIVDGIYKWAPNGNAAQTNFKLQGEYFRRRETGTLDFASTSPAAVTDAYASAQSGWYLQGVYQFRPLWRVGLRYDKLYSGTPDLGATLDRASLPLLTSYNPSRSTVMLDYSPSEFSRLRLQVARDKSRPGASDNQIFLQYIMSLGAHGAHTF